MYRRLDRSAFLSGLQTCSEVIAVHIPYWEFFLSIEDELSQTTRYVDFNDDHMATLQNVLGATMGLMSILLYYYRLVFVDRIAIDPPPNLLSPAHYGPWTDAARGWSYTLPDD